MNAPNESNETSEPLLFTQRIAGQERELVSFATHPDRKSVV